MLCCTINYSVHKVYPNFKRGYTPRQLGFLSYGILHVTINILLLHMICIHNIPGPVGSNHGNLGQCPRPWRRVVTDPSKHCYLPR